MADETFLPKRGALATVHIFGAGITGLTAAHELARRGFRVQVYEPAQEYGELGRPEAAHGPATRWSWYSTLAVGGMARSRYLRAARGAPGNFPLQGQLTSSAESRFVYEYMKDWRYDEGRRWSLVVDDRVRYFFSPGSIDRMARIPGFVSIRAPRSGKWIPSAREAAAAALRENLARGEPRFEPDRLLVVDDKEEWRAVLMETPYPELEDEDVLLVERVHFLPGEHGFRLFPASYRHLLATMRETLLLDEHGRPTGRRVSDNLVPARVQGIAAGGSRCDFPRQAPPGCPASDTVRFTLRLWRYLCTCSERRKAEYEYRSWWEYLEGPEPRTGTRQPYSEAFKRALRFTPRLLAAVDGARSDARTHGNALAQLYLDGLRPGPGTDSTLNGPTTPAWLRPWRRYLEESLGVTFRFGKLSRLVLEERTGLLRPYVAESKKWEGWEETKYQQAFPVKDYYLVATDAVTAEELTRDLPPIGVVAGLRRFTSWIPPDPRGPEPAQPRPQGVLPGHVPWDRFQTLTSIQLFFPYSVQLAEGCLCLLDTPWGLSALSSHQSWATPPTLDQDGFAAVLSVDIANWHAREPGRKSPAECSRHELAHEVWGQLRRAFEQHHAPHPYRFALPEPSWYEVDRFLRFEKDEATGHERPVENRAPYLVPIVGDWDRRPGPEPWDPWAPPAARKPWEQLPGGLWQAPHGGYYVHWDRLVFAGTYLKTFTRMTSMEAANESARHAVNAIIDHYLAFRGLALPDAGGPGGPPDALDTGMTPIGEYCRIWDPERHELPELEPLRALDARLFDQDRPHVWDVLELEPLAAALLPPHQPLGSLEALREFLRDACKRLETAL